MFVELRVVRVDVYQALMLDRCHAFVAADLLAITLVSQRCGVSSVWVARASSKVGHYVQYVLLKSIICSFGSPSNASMVAPLQATCPNVVHGLTSWNFNTYFLVDSKEQVLSDVEARLR
jgi:hypothetical protein